MKTRILVVDEHDLVRVGITAILSGHDEYLVHASVVPPRYALRQIAAQKPDLVIIDPHYQEAIDLKLLEEVREKYPALRLLVLTDSPNPANISRALQQRVNGYMFKSSPAADLPAAIDTITAGRTFLHHDASHALISAEMGAAFGDNKNSSNTLTIRQEQVLRMIADGKTTRQMASALGLSAKTIESHRVMLMNRIGVHHIPGLVRYALRHGYANFEAANDASARTGHGRD